MGTLVGSISIFPELSIYFPECCNLAPGPELAKLNFVCDNCQEGSQVRATSRLIKIVAKVH
jgi:hypothetical protein